MSYSKLCVPCFIEWPLCTVKPFRAKKPLRHGNFLSIGGEHDTEAFISKTMHAVYLGPIVLCKAHPGLSSDVTHKGCGQQSSSSVSSK